jgi:serine/threonine protein kinase
MASLGISRERLALQVQIRAHPNIVTLAPFDMYGEDKGYRYIVFEKLDFTLRDAGRLDECQAAHVAVHLVRALCYIHSRGFVYQDLKRDNIMFRSGVPVLIDFGCTHAFRSYGTGKADITNVQEGTKLYMSTFQECNEPLAPRNDLESLGFVLIDAMGRLPWRSARDDATIKQIKMETSPRALADSLDRCWRKYFEFVRKMGPNQVADPDVFESLFEELASKAKRIRPEPDSAAPPLGEDSDSSPSPPPRRQFQSSGRVERETAAPPKRKSSRVAASKSRTQETRPRRLSSSGSDGAETASSSGSSVAPLPSYARKPARR